MLSDSELSQDRHFVTLESHVLHIKVPRVRVPRVRTPSPRAVGGRSTPCCTPVPGSSGRGWTKGRRRISARSEPDGRRGNGWHWKRQRDHTLVSETTERNATADWLSAYDMKRNSSLVDETQQLIGWLNDMKRNSRLADWRIWNNSWLV